MFNQLFELQEEIFKAYAHSRRLEIIHLLRDQELTVGEIYTMLDLPQANISQHLQILREKNIVKATKVGKQIVYKITDSTYLHIADLVRDLLKKQHTNCNYAHDLQLELTQLVPLTHDPVCTMRLSPKTAGFLHTHNNKVYYFCASGCMEEFKRNPKKYSKKV